MSIVNYDCRLFKTYCSRENGYRNLKLIATKRASEASLAVFADGTISTFLTPRIAEMNTTEYFRKERDSRARQIWKNLEGKVYSIDYPAVIRYAYPKDYMNIVKYSGLEKSTKRMYDNMKNGIKPNWRKE